MSTKVKSKLPSWFEGQIYEEFKHDEFVSVKPLDLMRLLFFNDPIPGLHTHSYGFHTATGRHIIHKLQDKYYEYKNN